MLTLWVMGDVCNALVSTIVRRARSGRRSAAELAYAAVGLPLNIAGFLFVVVSIAGLAFAGRRAVGRSGDRRHELDDLSNVIVGGCVVLPGLGMTAIARVRPRVSARPPG